MERQPSPRAPEPVCVKQGWPQRIAAPKRGLCETMGLLSRVLGAGEECPDLSALSAALKAKLGLYNLKKPPPTMSPGVELLGRDVRLLSLHRPYAVHCHFGSGLFSFPLELSG